MSEIQIVVGHMKSYGTAIRFSCPLEALIIGLQLNSLFISPCSHPWHSFVYNIL